MPGKAAFSKVPQVILAFWIIKVLATTLGETGGDAISMSLKLGYAVASLIFLVFFAVTLAAQVASKRYHPFFYWMVVAATTTVGTTTSDFFDRTMSLGYVKSSAILLAAVIAILTIWRRATGAIAVDRVTTRPNEIFYWLTILFSNTLGTALGDFVATTTGLGFEGGALVFSALIALVAALHFLTRTPTAILFWASPRRMRERPRRRGWMARSCGPSRWRGSGGASWSPGRRHRPRTSPGSSGSAVVTPGG